MTDDLREKLNAAIENAYGKSPYYGSFLVVVPHRDNLPAVRDMVAEMMLAPVQTKNTHMVGDDYVQVYLWVVNTDAAKGRSLNAIFIPDDSLLSSEKIKAAKEFRINAAAMTNIMVTYT